MTPARKRASYADIEALPEWMVGEILGGELVASPRPGRPHARTASALGGSLGGPFDWGDGPGGWWILDEPELHLTTDPDFPVVVPDLAGWRRDRMPEVGDGPAFDLAPDWVCEILSPSTAGYDRSLKLPFYAAAGVGHAWLVDPILQTLEIFRLEASRWVLIGVSRGGAVVRAEPFEAVELALARLWHKPPVA